MISKSNFLIYVNQCDTSEVFKLIRRDVLATFVKYFLDVKSLDRLELAVAYSAILSLNGAINCCSTFFLFFPVKFTQHIESSMQMRTSLACYALHIRAL